MILIGKRIEVEESVSKHRSQNEYGLAVIHRAESGQGWSIPLDGVEPKDLRELANILERKKQQLNEIVLHIVEMRESSGNIQYFVRLYKGFESLDYYMSETKTLSKEEALERAWFSAGFVARFLGISNSDIYLTNFENIEDEKTIIGFRNVNRN